MCLQTRLQTHWLQLIIENRTKNMRQIRKLQDAGFIAMQCGFKLDMENTLHDLVLPELDWTKMNLLLRAN